MNGRLCTKFCAAVDSLVKWKLDTVTSSPSADDDELTYFEDGLELSRRYFSFVTATRPAMKCSVQGREFYVAQGLTPKKRTAACDIYVAKVPSQSPATAHYKNKHSKHGGDVFAEDLKFIGIVPQVNYQALVRPKPEEKNF